MKWFRNVSIRCIRRKSTTKAPNNPAGILDWSIYRWDCSAWGNDLHDYPSRHNVERPSYGVTLSANLGSKKRTVPWITDKRKRAVPLLNRNYDIMLSVWQENILIPGGMLYRFVVLDLNSKPVSAWEICSYMSASRLRTQSMKLWNKKGHWWTCAPQWPRDSIHISIKLGHDSRMPRFFVQIHPWLSIQQCCHRIIFGALKPECLYRAYFTMRVDAASLVCEYVVFFNFERISLKLSSHQLKSGVSPRKLSLSTIGLFWSWDSPEIEGLAYVRCHTQAHNLCCAIVIISVA